MAEKRSDIMITRAANSLRKAALLDRTRRAELSGVADYLESIVYQEELRAAPPKFDQPALEPSGQDGVAVSREVKRMMKPFKVRLVR